KNRKPADDLYLIALLERFRRHSVWRDMFRYNDAAITSLAADTAHCFLTYAFDPAETNEFSNLLFIGPAASTTDHEAYNLLLDQFTEWFHDDKLWERFSRYGTPNWDGYGADPITLETIRAARKFLKMLPKGLGNPEIAPGSDGIIALEWLFEERYP